MAQWLRLRTPNAGGLGLIPDQGTRSQMHVSSKSLHATAGAHVPQLRSWQAATKTGHNQISKLN